MGSQIEERKLSEKLYPQTTADVKFGNMEAAINCADTISEKSSYMEHISQSDAQISFM